MEKDVDVYPIVKDGLGDGHLNACKLARVLRDPRLVDPLVRASGDAYVSQEFMRSAMVALICLLSRPSGVSGYSPSTYSH